MPCLGLLSPCPSARRLAHPFDDLQYPAGDGARIGEYLAAQFGFQPAAQGLDHRRIHLLLAQGLQGLHQQAALPVLEARVLQRRLAKRQDLATVFADGVFAARPVRKIDPAPGTWVDKPRRFRAASPEGWMRQLNLRAKAPAT